MIRKYLSLCLIATVAISACKKDKGFGSGNLPSESTLEIIYDENTAIEAKVLYEDPLRTDRMVYNYLGQIVHPTFGKTTASTSVTFGLPANFNLEKAPFEVEDVNLYLFYDDFYGDSTVPVSFAVYELDHTINTQVTYKSDFNPTYNSTPIGELQNIMLEPNTPKPLREGDTTLVVGFMKIPLEKSFGDRVRDFLHTGLITNDTMFINRFPGLHLNTSASPQAEAMIQLDQTHTSAGVYITLKDKDGDNQILVLPFGTSKFTHTTLLQDYSSTHIDQVIQNGGVDMEEKLYLQSQAGVKTEVNFLDIEKYKGKIINKAVLEIYEVEKPLDNFKRALAVYPLKKGASGNNEPLDDYQDAFWGPGYLDTTATTTSGESVVKYEINITKLLKDYAIGKDDFQSIYLTNYPVFSEQPKFVSVDDAVKSFHIEPNSLIFGSPDYPNQEKRMKFKVWYSLKK